MEDRKTLQMKMSGEEIWFLHTAIDRHEQELREAVHLIKKGFAHRAYTKDADKARAWIKQARNLKSRMMGAAVRLDYPPF